MLALDICTLPEILENIDAEQLFLLAMDHGKSKCKLH